MWRALVVCRGRAGPPPPLLPENPKTQTLRKPADRTPQKPKPNEPTEASTEHDFPAPSVATQV
ncbi:hypothetical protein ZHAS_00017163 [Anopheles sinensis]|uniref:Uncharacterized protein n=1 Tax=Anopheles sinensis TaxID=74873 RepID=A0A084WFA5_ANOSI|nr:hypothetical protein ZHAS_00017163 [Anopheles sinensis]